jgi:hypothetical protein
MEKFLTLQILKRIKTLFLKNQFPKTTMIIGE